MTFEEKKSAYAAAGVDIDAANDAVSKMRGDIESTRIPGVLSGVGSFGGMFALSALSGITDPVLVSSVDSVGTKVNIAFKTNIHDTIGRDLVWHCVNDILVQGARPLFFLDYLGMGKVTAEVTTAIVRGIAEGCRKAGCALIGGETAELPGLYSAGEYDVAGTIVGVVDRNKIVDGSNVKAGDVVIGLASDGLHTNGYTLARHALLEQAGYELDEPLEELEGATLTEALLWPHRCYAPAVLPLVEAGRIKAMAHITGGGLLENIPRVLPAGVGVEIESSRWNIPPLFTLIQRAGDVDEHEMYRVFNMGIGFVLIVDESEADAVLRDLDAADETVMVIGRTVTGQGVQIL
jgi:phosphoribosylformylglycinamidine cyclo-ligase